MAVDAFAVRAIWKPDGSFGVNTAQREICNVIRGMDVQDVLVMKDSGTIGTFRLLEGESGQVIAECPVPAGEAEATLRIPAGRDLAISLEVEPNCGAVVGPIYFEAETDEAGLRR